MASQKRAYEAWGDENRIRDGAALAKKQRAYGAAEELRSGYQGLVHKWNGSAAGDDALRIEKQRAPEVIDLTGSAPAVGAGGSQARQPLQPRQPVRVDSGVHYEVPKTMQVPVQPQHRHDHWVGADGPRIGVSGNLAPCLHPQPVSSEARDVHDQLGRMGHGVAFATPDPNRAAGERFEDEVLRWQRHIQQNATHVGQHQVHEHQSAMQQTAAQGAQGLPTQYPHGLPTQYSQGLPTQYSQGLPTQYPHGLHTQYPQVRGYETPAVIRMPPARPYGPPATHQVAVPGLHSHESPSSSIYFTAASSAGVAGSQGFSTSSNSSSVRQASQAGAMHLVQGSEPVQPYTGHASRMQSSQASLPGSQPIPQPVSREPSLCKEQKDLVNLILSGKNVFYTGSAGCGKSTVLKAFVKGLQKAGLKFHILAPTGKAALEVNGQTYFTFAGWTPDSFKKPVAKLKKEATFQKYVQKRMKAVNVLIFDEISMVENQAFERLNMVMKAARGNDEAFGGVQLVVTGDFCQLPPVKPFATCIECGRQTTAREGGKLFTCPDKEHGPYKDVDKWAFASKAWQECNFAHVNLTKIHRQKDKAFITILEKCRTGQPLTFPETDLLMNHETNIESAVRLFSTREEVSRLNMVEYAKLKTEPRKYQCFDHIQTAMGHDQMMQWKARRGPDGSIMSLNEHKFEKVAQLRSGMAVVLQVNLSIEQGLVNGSQGVVIDFELYDPARMPRVVEKKEKQKPESTATNAIVGEYANYREQRIKDFIDAAGARNQGLRQWPVVRFENGVVRTIFAECIVNTVGDQEPYSLLSRTQIPLTAGWAMTVHKSQGMTLSKVIVDLTRSFEEGQMYVALSRARTLEGLKVLGLGRWTGGNEEVTQWLREKFPGWGEAKAPRKRAAKNKKTALSQ